MIVNGNGKNFFAALLINNVLIKMTVNFFGLEQMLKVITLFLSPFFHHDFIAQLNAFITDIDARSSDQLLDFFLTLTTKGTTVIPGGCAFLCHKVLDLNSV
jgi:hypothetical protein